MNKPINMETRQDILDEEDTDDYTEHIMEVILDIVLAIILGILVNIASNFLGKKIGMGFTGIIIIQIFLIANVLHFVKKYFGKNLHSWQGKNDYGIVFVAIFLSVQKNLTQFLGDLGNL